MAKKMSRTERQNNEGYASVKTELPSDRFQGEKQVLTPDQMSVTDNSIPNGVTNNSAGESAAKTLRSKIKVAPDVSVEQLEGKQVGGVPLTVTPSLLNAAGVSKQSPADDASKVPYSGGGYRPTTRYAKKRSEDLFELDNTVSEQVVPLVEDLADLRDAPEDSVGYNGRKQFKQTRSKKNASHKDPVSQKVVRLPQQLLNDVSADFVDVNQVVYVSGQMLDNIQNQADYPTKTYDMEQEDMVSMDEHPENIMKKGNYQPTALKITCADGMITKIDLDENVYKASGSAITRDQANFNWQIDQNNIANTMVKIQTEMGRETTDKWTPLAYVIREPYQYNMLLHDIELSTGATMATAYRAAVSSMAYQRNITCKDGVNPQRNAIKMITEGYAGVLASDDRATFGDFAFGTGRDDGAIFNKGCYRQGSVAGLINMFDSVTKYRTKADLLGLQRSLPLHLSQADNNLDMLRVSKKFMKLLDAAHIFSTLDGNYNPMLPIYQTKNIKLIYPLSLKRFLKGWTNPKLATSELKDSFDYDPETGTVAPYVYAYSDIRNHYTTRVQHPLIDGICRWLLKHEGAFVSTFCQNGKDGDITIPFNFDFQNPSLLEFIICSAAQDVAWERNVIFRDVLFAGEQSTYIWDDLVPVKEVDPLSSSQLHIGKYDEPLKMGKLRPDTAIRLLWSDHMQLGTTNGGVSQYFAPWHFNERSFGTTAGGTYTEALGFVEEEVAFNATFPSIREGVRHEYVDLIKSMTPKDVYLSLDRRMALPTYTSKTEDGGTTTYELTGSADGIKLSSLRYDNNSDGRIIVKYDFTSGVNEDLRALGLYCIPKEIGGIDWDFTPFTVIKEILAFDADGITVNGDVVDFERVVGGLNNSYCYDGALPVWLTSYRVEADAADNGAIDRAAALTQVFYRLFATPTDAASTNDEFVAKTGLIPCLAYNNGVVGDVTGCYNLNSDRASTHVVTTQIRTASSRMWTLLQRLFFPINPFANAFSLTDASTAYDPMEQCFYFGVCGTLAADYTQMVLERLDIFDQLGMNYTEDIYIKESPIFR